MPRTVLKTRKQKIFAPIGLGVLLLAMGASALFGAGLVASAFAPQAQALFVVFSAVLVLHGATKVFGDRWRAPGRGERTLIMSGRAVGAMMVLAAPLAVMSYWSAHDLTAEKIGRQVDRSVAGISQRAHAAYEHLASPPTE